MGIHPKSINAITISHFESILASYEEQYDSHFLDTTHMRFRYLGPVTPETSQPRQLATATPSFDPLTPDPRVTSPIPGVRPVTPWGTHTDPLIREVKTGFNRLERVITQSSTPTRGWERLADTFASLLDRLHNLPMESKLLLLNLHPSLLLPLHRLSNNLLLKSLLSFNNNLLLLKHFLKPLKA